MQRFCSRQGFTLPELMIAALILLPVFMSTMLTFLKCLQLNDLTRTTSAAAVAVRDRMTEMEQTSFDQTNANFNGVTFTVPGLNGIGVTYVDASQANLLRLTATFCWQLEDGRVIGQDKNLNGQTNTGEDTDGNGILDSPVTFTTMRYRM